MRIDHRTRATLIGSGALLTIALSGGSAFAAPYTDDATLAVSTTNPAVGGTVVVTLANYDAGESIVVRVDGTTLATFTANGSGGASGPVTLPAGLKCTHTLTGTGQTSHESASSTILIGPSADCAETGGGNLGSGNTGGGGNLGDNNVGSGNVGSGNVGSGNTGNNNTGYGNTVDGNTGSGNTPYSPTYGTEGYGAGPDDDFRTTGFSAPVATAAAHDDAAPVAVAAMVGLATVGGISFVRRRRTTS